MTSAGAKADLARWPEVAATDQSELARMSLEAKFARFVTLTAAVELRQYPAAPPDLRLAERRVWASFGA